MNFAGLLCNVPSSLEIVVADVGSAGGLAKRWRPVERVVSPLLFEPRAGGDLRTDGRARVFPVALGAAPGTARLNLTALGNMSSTLLPNRELLSRFRKKPQHAKVVGTTEIPVDTLDNIARAAGLAVDVLKVDTQGSELDVLTGAEESLSSSVLFAEVEVSFMERYHGQGLLSDVQQRLGRHGFELIDLYRIKRYRHANSAGIGNISLGGGQRAGRIAYADAWFFLNDEALQARVRRLDQGAQAAVLKAVLILLVYGKPDMAARTFDILAQHIEPDLRDRWSAALRRLARASYGFQNLHHVVDYLARRS